MSLFMLSIQPNISLFAAGLFVSNDAHVASGLANICVLKHKYSRLLVVSMTRSNTEGVKFVLRYQSY